MVLEPRHLTGHLLLVLAGGAHHLDRDPLAVVLGGNLGGETGGERLLDHPDLDDGVLVGHDDRLKVLLLGVLGALVSGGGDNLAHHHRGFGVADTLRLDLVEPPQKRLVLLQVKLVVEGHTLLAGHVLEALHHPPGLDDVLIEALLALLQLLLADVDDVLAGAKSLAGVVVELKLGASLDESLLGGGGALQNDGEALVPVALVTAALLLLRLHVHRLEVVVELEVDGPFRRSQLDVHRDLPPLDLVNLGDVLPDEAVQEALGNLVPGLVPVLRGLLLEELERLSLGDLLLGEPWGLVGTEVGAEEGRGVLDLAKRANRGSAREAPPRLGLEPENHAPVAGLEVGELVDDDSSPVEHLEGRGGGFGPVLLNLRGVKAPVILIPGLNLVVLVASLGALLSLGGACLGGLLALGLSLVALGVNGGEVILGVLDGRLTLKLRVVGKVVRLGLGVFDNLSRRGAPGCVPGPRREGLERSLLGNRLGGLDRGRLGLGLAESRGGSCGLLGGCRDLLDGLGSRRRRVGSLDVPEALLATRSLGDVDQRGTLEALRRDVHDLLLLGEVAGTPAHVRGCCGGAFTGESLDLVLERAECLAVRVGKLAARGGGLAVGEAVASREPREALEVGWRSKHGGGADDHVRLLHLLDGEVGDVGDSANDDRLELALLGELLNLPWPLAQELGGREYQGSLRRHRADGIGRSGTLLGPSDLGREHGSDGDGRLAVSNLVGDDAAANHALNPGPAIHAQTERWKDRLGNLLLDEGNRGLLLPYHPAERAELLGAQGVLGGPARGLRHLRVAAVGGERKGGKSLGGVVLLVPDHLPLAVRSGLGGGRGGALARDAAGDVGEGPVHQRSRVHRDDQIADSLLVRLLLALANLLLAPLDDEGSGPALERLLVRGSFLRVLPGDDLELLGLLRRVRVVGVLDDLVGRLADPLEPRGLGRTPGAGGVAELGARSLSSVVQRDEGLHALGQLEPAGEPRELGVGGVGPIVSDSLKLTGGPVGGVGGGEGHARLHDGHRGTASARLGAEGLDILGQGDNGAGVDLGELHGHGVEPAAVGVNLVALSAVAVVGAPVGIVIPYHVLHHLRGG